MGMLHRLSWLSLFHIFRKFSNASGLYMNAQKSILYHGDCDLDTIIYIKNLFGIDFKLMGLGMKYLGYHIKPCNYRNSNWLWLVDRFLRKSLDGNIGIYPWVGVLSFPKLF